MCHMSRFSFHMSPATFQNIFCFNLKNKEYFPEKIGQSGGACRCRACYQRGLPRLVLKCSFGHLDMVLDGPFGRRSNGPPRRF